MVLLACCVPWAPGARAAEQTSLAEARRAFKTKLTKRVSLDVIPDKPPKGVLELIRYRSPVGSLAAYVTPKPKDKRKRPAIVWIHGGNCNTIGDVWSSATPANDQTASAYREAGIVMMFPALRGGNERRGVLEGFYGEVDDVVAAADHLAAQPHVDPERIYLGGHSTGGTLALLVAACSDRFRAVISFGPVSSVGQYTRRELPFDKADPQEMKLRSPALWLHSVTTPTYVLEGAGSKNVRDIKSMSKKAPPAVQFLLVDGVDHFSILAPANKVLAQKILKDTGPQASLELTGEELKAISPSASLATARLSGKAATKPAAGTREAKRGAEPGMPETSGDGLD